MHTKLTVPVVAAFFVAFGLMAVPADADDLSAHLLEKMGVSHGVCTMIGGSDPGLVLALADASGLLIHVIDSDAGVVADLRSAGLGRGLPLQRLVVEQASLVRLPYTDNMIDAVLAINPSAEVLQALSTDEILRVLRPRGKAIIGVSKDASGAASRADLRKWAKVTGIRGAKVDRDREGSWVEIVKPELAGVDDWSHWEHGPDNNPVSTDAVIKAPYIPQWLGLPYYIPMPAITTAAGGRTFLAMGHIAHHEREEALLNTILARNGYNGAHLWTKRLPDGYLVHRSAFVATDDTFYMIDLDGQGCLMLDPETGVEKDRVRVPKIPGEWKWMVLEDNMLYVMVGEKRDDTQTTVVRSKDQAWSWGELSAGYYTPRVPWGFGETIFAYDLGKKKVMWTHREDSIIDSRGMVMGGGKVFFYGPDSRFGCLEAKSGKVVWINDDPKIRELIEEPGRGLKSTPGFRSQCFSVYTPKGLFYEAQTRMNVVVVSLEDGSLLWNRKKTTNNPNVIYLDGKILAGIGPGGSTLVVEPETGKMIEDLGFAKRSCARLTATPDSLFCRGMPEGITRYDRAAKKIYFDGSMRPACNDGVIGANGLLYLGPWPCDCNLTLMGTLASTSAGDFDPAAMKGERVAFVSQSPSGTPLDCSDADWLTYRGDNAHSGSSPASVAGGLAPLWTYGSANGLLPTAPTTAGGLVFLSGEDGIVRAVEAQSGATKWTFATAGPIMQPPAIAAGRAFVGSGDGHVYALDAATGALLWRFRAAPTERRMMMYGFLCSSWPVNSGLIVEDGVVYAAAGIIDYAGTYVYAIDAATGETRWANNSSGHLDKEIRKGVSAQGNLTLLNGRLWMASGNVINPAAFDLRTGEYRGVGPGDGSPRVNRGEEIGVFNGEHLVFGGRLRYSVSENIINPGQFIFSSASGKATVVAQGRSAPVWDAEQFVLVPDMEEAPQAFGAEAAVQFLEKEPDEVPALWNAEALDGSETLALALAKDAVVAACKTPRPRNLQPDYRVRILNREDGALIAERRLPAPPKPNGIAIDRDGRILVAMLDGRVACFGGDAIARVAQ